MSLLVVLFVVVPIALLGIGVAGAVGSVRSGRRRLAGWVVVTVVVAVLWWFYSIGSALSEADDSPPILLTIVIGVTLGASGLLVYRADS